ncbi:hypothetical protein CRG98_044181 [Punica granatum]|uniref:Uncharacterized protein n=1 Tax=Punica granatum TaxID=22663 RepID=A0A2I0HUP4_PUNGR|nr:hypothetical protein CRG98_044181 [Punica granatum]
MRDFDGPILNTFLWAGITVTNGSGSLAKDAHDHALALLIDVLQQITAADQFVCGSWLAKGEYPYGSKVSSFLVEAGQDARQ